MVETFRKNRRYQKFFKSRRFVQRPDPGQPPEIPFRYGSEHGMAVGIGVVALFPGLPKGGGSPADHVSPTRIDRAVHNLVDLIGMACHGERLQDVFGAKDARGEMTCRFAADGLEQGVGGCGKLFRGNDPVVDQASKRGSAG